MAINTRDFPARHARILRQGLATIRKRLENPPGPIPRDLLEMLQAILTKPRPIVDLVYGGAQGVCKEPYARSAGYRVLLCAKAFLPEPRSRHAQRVIRLPAVLFHELIHIARGWELDAEAFENAWFSAEEGARSPDQNDWSIFKEDKYEGWWVQVNPRTRRVTDYADRAILTFPHPASGRSTRSRRRGR
jgi:hypothetical protein